MNYPLDELRLNKELIEVFGEEEYNHLADIYSVDRIVEKACAKCYIYRLHKEEIRKQGYNQGI